MKKIIFLIPIILISFLLTACTSTNALVDYNYNNDDELIIRNFSADWRSFSNTEDMIVHATDIVRAEMLDERVELINHIIPWTPESIALMFPCGHVPEDNPQYDIFTVTRAKVVEVFKGNTQVGDIIEINQMGGRLGNEHLICRARVHFETGEDLVVFLRQWITRDNAYGLMSPFQAVYRFPSSYGEGIATLSFDKELESFVDTRHSLPLTLGDLMQVAVANFGHMPEFEELELYPEYEGEYYYELECEQDEDMSDAEEDEQ